MKRGKTNWGIVFLAIGLIGFWTYVGSCVPKSVYVSYVFPGILTFFGVFICAIVASRFEYAHRMRKLRKGG